MALSAQAALLDELMGRNRNLGANDERKEETRWDDFDVCKHYLCGFCPHDLFINTKADLGRCEKLHEEDMRKDYQESTRKGKMGYEEDFERYLNVLMQDVDRKIRRGHERLEMNAALANSRINSTKEERTELLTNKINELVQQAEELGTQGNVEEAQGVMKLCDQLVEERAQLETASANPNLQSEFEKEMEVCEVCGALLVVNDVQQRVDEHLMGKQHMGYARIRATVVANKEKKAVADAKLMQAREAREAELEKRRKERREASAERKRLAEKARKESRSRDRHSRDHRSSSRSRQNSSRDRHHKRSRSRDRRKSNHRRSKSREHKSSRNRSRSRDRSRERSRRSHRSRDRKSPERSHHKSRDNSKDRSRGKSPDRSGDHSKRRSSEKDKDKRSKSKENSHPVENDVKELEAPSEETEDQKMDDNGEATPAPDKEMQITYDQLDE